MQRADITAQYNIGQIAELSNENRLLVMPCKMGTTLYVLFKRGVYALKFVEFVFNGGSSYLGLYGDLPYDLASGTYPGYIDVSETDIGETVFFNASEAQEAYNRSEDKTKLKLSDSFNW